MVDNKRTIEVISEELSSNRHKEFQNVNTRVSEYLMKYGQGKIDALPTDSRTEIEDNRTVDEMLDDENPIFGLGTEESDVLFELQANMSKFEKAQVDIEASEKDKKSFENAMQVINDKNSSDDAKRDAYRILDKLEKAGKLSYD